MPIPFHLTGFMVMMMMTKGEGRSARGGQPFFMGGQYSEMNWKNYMNIP